MEQEEPNITVAKATTILKFFFMATTSEFSIHADSEYDQTGLRAS
jgi:hypothetical protein